MNVNEPHVCSWVMGKKIDHCLPQPQHTAHLQTHAVLVLFCGTYANIPIDLNSVYSIFPLLTC